MYYPFFDWLRMILALIVAIGHSGLISWQHSGNLAVQIFFALSGWLIGGILLNLKIEELPRFFFNRVARIWVPYVVAVALLVCASLLRDPFTLKWGEFVFYKMTFVYNWFGSSQLAHFRQEMPLAGTGNHFWSICTEEQFYLFAPIVLLILPARIGKSILLWLSISLITVSFDLYGAITLGVLAAVCQKRFVNWQLNRAASFCLTLLLILSVGLMYSYTEFYYYIAPLFAIILVLLLARTGQKSKWGQFWGGVSYPFYLNHWIGVFVANEIFEHFGLREALVSKIVALIFNIIIATVLYILIDSTVRQYRDHFFTERRGIFATCTAYSLLFIGTSGGAFFLDSRII